MAEGASTMPPGIRDQLVDIPSSLIRETFNYGTTHPQADEIIPLWFGEGDLVTPKFVGDALKASLDAGDTFYSSNSGIPELRTAIAAYLGRTYGKSVMPDRITVTASGMAAITLVVRTLLDAGDNMIVVGPLWPNCADSARVQAAEPRMIDLELKDGRWQLDMERLFDLADERTKAVFVNSPNNPTGWMMSREEQETLLDFCRARGLWLIADEVYDRIVYDAPANGPIHAPSFVELATPDDAVIALNSFSKSWCMTGWRLGWMVAPPRLLDELGKLIEFTWSCSPVFVQKAGIAALEQGEDFIAEMVDRCRRGRDLVYQRLAANPRIRIAEPEAAFYAFFGVDGVTDSAAFAKRLIDEARVGIAPGRAFGEGGEGYMRLCFASDTARLSEAMDRMDGALK